MLRFVVSSLALVVCFGCGGIADGGLFSANAGGATGTGGNSSAGTTANSGGAESGGTSSSNGGTMSSAGTSSAGASNAGTGGSEGGASNAGAPNGGAAHGGRAGEAGSPSGGKPGALQCDELVAKAYEALEAARACNPNTDGPHCLALIEDPCGCTVPIEQLESPATQKYRAALEQMEQDGCAVACLAIVCEEPNVGYCLDLGGGHGTCSNLETF